MQKNTVTAKQIEEYMKVIDNFNYLKVHSVMQFLNWKWATCTDDEGQLCIPTIEQMQAKCIWLFTKAIETYNNQDSTFRSINHETEISTGGFEVHYSKTNNKEYFKLLFVLTYQSNDIDD